MSKPSGINIGMNERGPTWSVASSSRVDNLIWEAVQEAILAGMTPEQFKREVADAWKYELSEESKRVQKILLK